MRDPERIEPFLARFTELWRRYPDLRFGQLVSAIEERRDGFYWEEERWLEEIEAFERKGFLA